MTEAVALVFGYQNYSSSSSFQKQLEAARDSPVRRPFTITLKPGLHTLLTLTLDAAFGASELWLIGEGDASIEMFDRATPLFILKPGAPPVHLRGLTLRGPVRVEGSELEMSNCTVRGAGGPGVDEGGGLRVSGGVATVVNSSFAGCRAKKGGAIAVLGGALEVARTTLTRNAADAKGGHPELKLKQLGDFEDLESWLDRYHPA